MIVRCTNRLLGLLEMSAAGLCETAATDDDHVERGSEVNTDGWGGYNDIGRHRFSHVATNVSASGDPAHVAMPMPQDPSGPTIPC